MTETAGLACDKCGAPYSLAEVDDSHSRLTCTECANTSVVAFAVDEIMAGLREIASLHMLEGAKRDEAAIAGPCFCRGKFTCTRCLLLS